MTGLIAWLEDNQAIIAMDTLASYTDHTPFKIVSKIMPILHTRSILCPFGDLELGLSIYQYVQSSILSHDIRTLIVNLQNGMQSFLDYFIKTHNQNPNGSLFFFGYDCTEQKYRGFVFRIIDGTFVLDEEPEGLITKPHTGLIDKESLLPLFSFDLNDIPSSLYNGICKMKIIDDNKKLEERVGIGGQVQIAILSDNGYQISTIEIKDFRETYNETCANLKKNE